MAEAIDLDRNPAAPVTDTGGRAATRSARDRAMLAYVTLAVLLLVPGALAAFGSRLGTSGPLGEALATLDAAMQHIAFGSGLRFWLGVCGATMMGLLLLYPLRKLFGVGSSMSVGSWFHLHAVLGLLGPVMIVYHTWFGTGSTPANVALATTLAVAVSGIFGHYVYTRLSADYHSERRRAEDLLRIAMGELGRLPSSPSRNKLVDDVEIYDRTLLSPGAGLATRLGLSRHLGSQRRDIVTRAAWIVDSQGPAAGWSEDHCRETRLRVDQSLNGFFDSIGRCARRSFNERIAAGWRLLHLPLFFITVVAASIHVYKVWNMDGPRPAVLEAASGRSAGGGSDGPGDGARGGAETTAVVSAGEDASAGNRGARSTPSTASTLHDGPILIAPRKVAVQTVTVAPVRSPAEPDPIAGLLEEPALVQVPSRVVRDTLVPQSPELSAEAVAPPAAPARPRAAASPETEMPHAEAGTVKPTAQETSPAPASAAPPAADPPGPGAAPLASTVDAASRAILAWMTPPAERPAGVGGPRPEADPVAELGRKVAQWDNTGKLDPKTVRERLAAFKADAAFDHDKTRFPLSGKHKSAACETCHKTTLKDTGRRCIDCHRKDDVHRGRRPKCESCHVTTDWGTTR